MNYASELKDIDDRFLDECELHDMESEYPNHPDETKYYIVTMLTLNEFRKRYAVLFPHPNEYVLLTPEQYEPILDSKRNNEKTKKNQMRHGIPLDFSEEIVDGWVSAPDVCDLLIKKQMDNTLDEFLSLLNKIQERRIRKHFFGEMSVLEIADDEGVSRQTVLCSLNRGIQKLRLHMTIRKITKEYFYQ